MLYYVRTVKSKRYYFNRGKEKGFQDGTKGARKYKSYDTAARSCQEIEVRTGIPCEFIDEFEVEKAAKNSC